MLTSMIESTMEESNPFDIKLRQGMWEVYCVRGGVVPKDLSGRFTEEHRAIKAIKDYHGKKILEATPVRIKAKIKDPKKPGRRPKGPKNGSSKDNNTAQ